MAGKTSVLVLAYAGCSTCTKALAFLRERGITPEVRPIVEQPPTAAELAEWIPKSGVSVRKWLNTSGQSYRAIGKDKVDAASDAELATWLTRDGKLVKRPVLVERAANATATATATASAGAANASAALVRVLVGFRPEAYEELAISAASP